MKNIIKIITDENFDEIVVRSTEPAVLVDFWASWCGPCKMMSAVVDEISEFYGSRLLVGKMNVDDNSNIPAMYKVRSIPTFALFKEGRLIGTKIGILSKQQLIDFIDSSLDDLKLG